MKLQQLRCLTEVARRGLNVSEAAEALHTSQPGVSKQIKALEDELGVQVFVRHGKRLVAVTEPGKAVVAIAERILSEAQNLRRAGEEFATRRSEEHTSELQSRLHLVCRLLLEKKKTTPIEPTYNFSLYQASRCAHPRA